MFPYLSQSLKTPPLSWRWEDAATHPAQWFEMRFLGVLKPPVDPCGRTVQGAAGLTDRQTDRQLVSLRSFDLKMRLKKSCAVLDIWAGLPGWGTFVWSLPLSLPLWQETEQQQRRKSCWLNLLCGVISAQFNQQQLIQPNYSPSWRARWSFFYALCNFRL